MSGVAYAVLDGWQVSGIVRFAACKPTWLLAPDTLGPFGFAVQRPNIISYKDSDVRTRTSERWFNIAADSAPVKFAIGPSPQYLSNIRIDGTTNADVTLMKNFNMRESLRIQFRAEAFNLVNTPRFGLPSTVPRQW